MTSPTKNQIQNFPIFLKFKSQDFPNLKRGSDHLSSSIGRQFMTGKITATIVASRSLKDILSCFRTSRNAAVFSDLNFIPLSDTRKLHTLLFFCPQLVYTGNFRRNLSLFNSSSQ